jgi:hypothetical protein
VSSTYQTDGNDRLPIFLLAYRASTHETTGMTPANVVFGKELRLPCDLLFGAPPDKEQSTTDYAADLVQRLHDTQHYARRYLKVASDRMTAHYDRLANSAVFQSGCTARLGTEVTETTVGMEGNVRGHYPDQRRCLQNSAAPPGKDDGGTP